MRSPQFQAQGCVDMGASKIRHLALGTGPTVLPLFVQHTIRGTDQIEDLHIGPVGAPGLQIPVLGCWTSTTTQSHIRDTGGTGPPQVPGRHLGTFLPFPTGHLGTLNPYSKVAQMSES